MYNSSEAPTVTPILGRLYSVQPNAKTKTGIVYFKRPKPFIIGFYHGREKPKNLSEFVSPMLNEFTRLHPTTSPDPSNPRHCTACLRCIICDTPMRSYLKGTKGHAGYWCCDRCIQRGEIIHHVLVMKNVDAPFRCDEDFHTYHTNDISIDEHITHPEIPNPFVDFGFKMVSGFVIDTMHTVHLGALLRRLEGFAFKVLEGKLTDDQLSEIERRIEFFRHCRPYDFHRHVDKFSSCSKYKAHVLRQFLYYFLFPVFEGILHEDELEHIMLLQYGMMLLGGYETNRQIKPSDVCKAHVTFDRYATELSDLGIPCRFVSHMTSHLWQDVSNFKNPVEANSAFDFETFLSFFADCLRSGYLPSEQIRNRLIEKAKYQLPTTSCGQVISNKIQLEMEASKKSSRSVQFINNGEKWPKKLVFDSYTISNKFPNNICLLKDGSIVVCTDICRNSSNRLAIVGREFGTLTTPFTKPYLATDHHIYRASNISVEESSWYIKDIKAKCYAFPLRPTAITNIFDSGQHWFMSPRLHTLN